MKTVSGYTGQDKNKFNEKYNFVAVFELINGEQILMNPSITRENCEKAANATANNRMGFEGSKFKISKLS